VRVLQRMVRGRFLAGVRELWRDGQLDGLGSGELRRVLRVLYGKTWVVHVQAPGSRRAAEVIRYLGAYVTRVGISDRRLVSMGGESVTFRTRGSATVTLPLVEFGRRFLLHVLPRGFKKVRYYGLLAPGNVGSRLPRAMELARAAATEPESEVEAKEVEESESSSSTVCCPRCGGELLWVGELRPQLRPRARGPPGGGR